MGGALRGFKGVLPAALAVYSVLDSIFSYLMWVVTSPYLKLVGVTPVEYGFFAALISGAAMASLPAAGWLSDRFSPLPTLVAGQMALASSAALIATARLPLIMAAAVATGLGHSLGWIPFEILVSRVVGRERYHYAYPLTFTLFQAGGMAGGFLGWVPQLASPAYGIPLATAYRYSILAAGAGQAALIPLLLKAGARAGGARAARPPSRAGGRGLRAFWDEVREYLTSLRGVPGRSRGALAALAVAEALIGFGAGVGISNVNYYFIIKYGVGSGALGTIQGVESGLMAVISMVTPKLSERVGGTLKAYVGLSSLSVPLLAAVTLVNNFAVAGALFVARTALMNAASPLMQAFIMRATPEGLRGRVNSLLALLSDLPRVAGAPIGGYLLSRVSLEAPLRVTAATYFAALAYLAFRARGAGECT